MSDFLGYVRADGSVGARNHLVVIPSVSCANGVAARIASEVPQAVPLLHGHGCGRGGTDLVVHFRTLANLGKNPNAGAALVVGLGCEVMKAESLAEAIATSGKPVECLEIQSSGGSVKAGEKGAALAIRMAGSLNGQRRESVGLEKAVVGLQCGGSDAFSGITANPAVGVVSDMVVAEGGTVILTENTEMIGASHILQRRACNPEVAGRVRSMVERAEERARDILGPMAYMVIAPGNMDGGISSIQEKSIGCIAKGGTSWVMEVIDYGDVPGKKGLVLMDAPGYDTESMAGMAASGAQVMLFTTGRGNPIGFPTVPVIKIASNAGLFRSMEDDIDVNAGDVLEGKSIEEVGDEIFSLLIRVLSGELAKAERNRQEGIVCLYVGDPSF